ncbi:MAG: HEAT repeat domain-containing protein, partial [Planctomycetota bacterium]
MCRKLIQRTIHVILAALIFVVVIGQSCVPHDGNLLSDINKLASLGDKAPETLTESVRDQIESDPCTIASALLPKLTDPNMSEKQLAIYVWALGLTEDPNAVAGIVKLREQSKSELVKGKCLGALATIGGRKSGDYLLSILEETEEKVARFT